MIATVLVEDRFEAAHRLIDHPGKFRFLHGHSFRAMVVLRGLLHPPTGIAIDSRSALPILRSLTHEILDHATLVQTNDPLSCGRRSSWYPQERLLLFPVPPSAECLALVVYGFVDSVLYDLGLTGAIDRVILDETTTSSAAVDAADIDRTRFLSNAALIENDVGVLAYRFGSYLAMTADCSALQMVEKGRAS